MGDINSSTRAAAVTPNDSTVVNCNAIYVGGAGNISVVLQSDNTPVTFTAVPVGSILPVAARIIRATGTTATLMVALF
jgi:hypothetical protein